MYRLFDRHLGTTTHQVNNSNTHESTSVIVFKCINKESKLLVDSIRNGNGKTLKNFRRLFKFCFLLFILIFYLFSVLDQKHEVQLIVV
jgi:hypothetical protein